MSDENAYLKLWKAIKRHNKTVEKDRRESLAIAIHKNFISDQSKYCLSFPQVIRDMLEENDSQHMPSTPVMNRLFQIAEDNLDPIVKQFLTSMGENERSFSAIQKKAHILSLALTLNKASVMIIVMIHIHIYISCRSVQVANFKKMLFTFTKLSVSVKDQLHTNCKHLATT